MTSLSTTKPITISYDDYIPAVILNSNLTLSIQNIEQIQKIRDENFRALIALGSPGRAFGKAVTEDSFWMALRISKKNNETPDSEPFLHFLQTDLAALMLVRKEVNNSTDVICSTLKHPGLAKALKNPIYLPVLINLVAAHRIQQDRLFNNLCFDILTYLDLGDFVMSLFDTSTCFRPKKSLSYSFDDTEERVFSLGNGISLKITMKTALENRIAEIREMIKEKHTETT